MRFSSALMIRARQNFVAEDKDCADYGIRTGATGPLRAWAMAMRMKRSSRLFSVTSDE